VYCFVGVRSSDLVLSNQLGSTYKTSQFSNHETMSTITRSLSSWRWSATNLSWHPTQSCCEHFIVSAKPDTMHFRTVELNVPWTFTQPGEFTDKLDRTRDATTCVENTSGGNLLFDSTKFFRALRLEVLEATIVCWRSCLNSRRICIYSEESETSFPSTSWLFMCQTSFHSQRLLQARWYWAETNVCTN